MIERHFLGYCYRCTIKGYDLTEQGPVYSVYGSEYYCTDCLMEFMITISSDDYRPGTIVALHLGFMALCRFWMDEIREGAGAG